ncbi:MAG: hypothetical protein ABI591_11675 [Kofleriaceae bacterium]
MSSRSEVLLWAQRIVAAKKTVPPHQMLEIKPDAGLDAAQEAFHKIARMAHPDLHRNNLEEAELELVTKAYAIVANAYQTFRNQTMATTRMKAVGANDVPVSPSGTNAVTGVAGAMSSRALVYYRKAELCLKRGDLRGAVLQLKMAIGTDPASTFLRTALHEVEVEARKVT